MKIVFIPNLPYTYRDHKRLGVEYFSKKYDVEVLDVNRILLPGYKEKVNIKYYKCDNYFEPNSLDEVKQRVELLNEKDFIFFYIAGKKGVELLHFMKKYTRAKFITYVGGAIPTIDTYCNFLEYISSTMKKIVKQILPKYKIQPFNADVFVAGSPTDMKIFPYLINTNTTILKAHSRDYTLCLEIKNKNINIIKEPYMVFLDTDVVDASDYIAFNMKVKTNIDEYLNKIIKFFKWLEKKYNMKVIISAHPKSRIYKNKEYINGIRVIHGKSAELVKECKFVINEGTTAISYALFFNKPLIFLTMKEIDFFYKHCCKFAKRLKKQIINIDNTKNLKHKIDSDLKNLDYYEDYINRYMVFKNYHLQIFNVIDKKVFSSES